MISLEELERVFTGWHERYWKRHRKELADARYLLPLFASANEGSDTSGNANFQIYQNTTDKIAVIGRVIIGADGYTPAAPFSGGWAALYTGQSFNNGVIFDMLPLATGGQVFPNVGEYSGHNALRLRQNETLSLWVQSGPVSKNLTAAIYGFLEPLTQSDRY